MTEIQVNEPILENTKRVERKQTVATILKIGENPALKLPEIVFAKLASRNEKLIVSPEGIRHTDKHIQEELDRLVFDGNHKRKSFESVVKQIGYRSSHNILGECFRTIFEEGTLGNYTWTGARKLYKKNVRR